MTIFWNLGLQNGELTDVAKSNSMPKIFRNIYCVELFVSQTLIKPG